MVRRWQAHRTSQAPGRLARSSSSPSMANREHACCSKAHEHKMPNQHLSRRSVPAVYERKHRVDPRRRVGIAADRRAHAIPFDPSRLRPGAGTVLARRTVGGLCVQRIRSSGSAGPPVRTRVRERPRERGGERGRVEVRRHGAPMESRRQGTLLHHAGRRDRLGSRERSPCAVRSARRRRCSTLPALRQTGALPQMGAGSSSWRRSVSTASTSLSLIFDWQEALDRQR